MGRDEGCSGEKQSNGNEEVEVEGGELGMKMLGEGNKSTRRQVTSGVNNRLHVKVGVVVPRRRIQKRGDSRRVAKKRMSRNRTQTLWKKMKYSIVWLIREQWWSVWRLVRVLWWK